ncbi:MAG: hypothetical protein JRG81_00210 [Deltaproteobacteria bacterium]|nr:hypothetical protein [Deltaproteobacteria bacterium]MBW2363500.1 hypothetical protein [Deltaproteobacteria bacterium]
MTGWKTKLGSGGVLCTGVAMIIAGFVGEPVNPDKMYQGAMVCFSALTALGIGHKVEKAAKK